MPPKCDTHTYGWAINRDRLDKRQTENKKKTFLIAGNKAQSETKTNGRPAVHTKNRANYFVHSRNSQQKKTSVLCMSISATPAARGRIKLQFQMTTTESKSQITIILRTNQTPSAAPSHHH